jgi:hypothetical protein
MRKMRVLYVVATVLLAALGCKHPPELKPPPQPEVLASPGVNDKRYAQPCSYPGDVLTDPTKGAMKDSVVPAAGKRPPTMSGTGMMGPGGY